MNWLNKLLGIRHQSGSVAKNRLQMVISNDRNEIGPDVIDEIREEIVRVIADRIEVDSDAVVVNVRQDENESRLVAEVPISNNRVEAAPEASADEATPN